MPPDFPAQRFNEAVARERFSRSVVFLDLPETLCGIEVRPLTLRHVVTLDVIRSPFVCGGKSIIPDDVTNFLWLISPRFEPNRLAKRWFALWHLRKVRFEPAIEAIVQFITDAFEDAPGDGKPAKQYYSTTAGMVDLLASQYGWPEQTILDLPVKRVLQYGNASVKRINPKAVLFNPSECVVGDWLRERDKVTS